MSNHYGWQWTISAVALLTIAILGLVLLATGMSFWRAAFVSLNIVTLLTYGCDKMTSQTGGSRVPEVLLHGLALFGGTPAAFVAQMVFHHKTRKSKFRTIFWMIVMAQAIVLTVFWLRK